MPQLTHFEVVVEVRTIVRESLASGPDRRVLLDVTTSGTAKGDTGVGLVAAAAPALTDALAHHSPIIETYRRNDTDAALAKRAGR